MAPLDSRMQARAEALAEGLPPLLVHAERVAATVALGTHGRRRVGRGETFWQFRRYQSGDAASAIDWRRSARADPLFVRETEWEAAQIVWLWADCSPSMGYRSASALPNKDERAALVVMALAALLVRGGEQVALLGRDMAPGLGRAALHRVAAGLLAPPEAAAAEGLPTPERLPRNSVVVMVGDFLGPRDDTAAVVRAFAHARVRGHLLQVLDPAEETLPFSGRVRFEGLEGEPSSLIGRVEAVRPHYRALLDGHRQAVAEACRASGWTFATHRTDHPPEAALMALYGALSSPAPAAGRR